MKQTFTFILLFLIIQSSFGQQTIILQPDGSKGIDAYLDELQPNNNFGNYRDVGAWYWTFNGIPGTGRSLIKFDLSTIPVGATIHNAKLSLYHNAASSNAGQAGQNLAFLQKVTSNWEESTVTWAFQPATTTVNQIILSRSISQNQNYTDIDVTSFVTGWYLNPQSNFGWMLKLETEELYRSMKFASSDQPNVSIRPKLEITYSISTIITEQTICLNEKIQLQGRSGYSGYLWSTGGTNKSIEVNSPGTYWVQNLGQPVITDTFKIKQSSIKIPNLGKDFSICQGESVELNAFQPNVSYKWQDGSISSTYEVKSPGTYWVEITDGTCMLRDSVIIFNECVSFIPNIITPNNDSFNDVFAVKGLLNDKNWNLEIFNRWGTKIYKVNSYKNEWNGNGNPDGIYFYYLVNEKTKKVFKGWVEILR